MAEEIVLTEDQKDAAAKEKGAVVVLRVNDSKGVERVAYLKAPDRYAVGAALSAMKTSITEACEYIYDSAVMKDISPDYELIRNDDEMFISSCSAIQAAIPFKKNNSKML